MRGLGRSFSTVKHPFLSSSSHSLSTFAGSGRGRGRGGAAPPPPAGEEPAAPGLGHGRGAPPPDKPVFFRREDLSPAQILDFEPSRVSKIPPISSESSNSPISRVSKIPPIGSGESSISPISTQSGAEEISRVAQNPPSRSIGRGKPSIGPIYGESASNEPSRVSHNPPIRPIGRGKPSIPSNYGESTANEASRVSQNPPIRPIGRGKPLIPSIPSIYSDSTAEEPSRVSPKPPIRTIGRISSEFAAEEGSRVTQLGFKGMGRGKPSIPSTPSIPGEENRHVRKRVDGKQSKDREEATRRAMDVLSRGGRGRGLEGRGVRGGRTGRGRGGRFGGRGQARDLDEYYGTGLFLGDNGDGEKLAARLGEETMGRLNDGFEEMGSRVLPSPMEEVYLEALHTNYSFEFEPEFHMVFTNPDIEEKPPVSLPEAFEKMKPFLMEYEGIQNQKEWEEIMEETMKKAPVLKELVDFYSGPDRVTAKQQDQELERVANTLPDEAPSSVKRFTDRALLSLKSNSGWGFGKKCQFMDKLTWEMSQQYK